MFLHMCEDVGLAVSPAEPVVTRDPTLLFANSTIVGFKDDLRTGIREPGYCVIQPCIRLQNLKAIRSQENGLDYMSCFVQAGTILPAGRLDAMLALIAPLLDELEVERDRVAVKICSELLSHRQLSNWLRSCEGWTIEQDREASSYYTWRYGLPGVVGVGMTLSLRNPHSDSLEDFGNLIAIYRDRKLLGWEFGFGLETLEARRLSYRTPFEASYVYSVLRKEIGEVPDLPLCDALQLSAALHCFGIQQGSGRRMSIMRRSVIDTVYNAMRLGIRSEQISRCATSICDESPSDLSSIYAHAWARIEQKMEQVREYVAYAKRHGLPKARVIEYAELKCSIPAAYHDTVPCLAADEE
jgi:hypothetical protein